MAQERLNHTPEGKMLVFTDHIMYEIKMLRMMYRFLEVPTYSGWAGNAFIESFCIHARVLLEFLEGTEPESSEQVCACHFTDNTYKSFRDGKVSGRLRGKLQAQVAHLSYQRAKTNEDKIGPDDRRILLELLNREIDRFAAHLRSPYKEQWPPELRSGSVSFAALPPQNVSAILTGSGVQPFTITPNTIMATYSTGRASEKK